MINTHKYIVMIEVTMTNVFRRRFEISEKRLAICETCDRFDKEKRKCLECGCFMEYKTLLPFVHCPLHKWGKEEEKEDGRTT